MAAGERFEGRIGVTWEESEPWWAPLPEHRGPKRPNVVIVLFDDTGFANFGCYGSSIETPNLDALAAAGLRYSNFHVTPLCSPTRASLLTGRNHHAVGMRTIGNYHDGGFPNMRAAVTKHAAMLGEMLQGAGYATYALGKWHLNPAEENSAAGPYDNWPLQRGFDRYYGFLGGATDQFYPELTYDNHHIEPPRTPEEGYHVTEDLVDHGIEFVRDKVSNRRDQPFFLYLALGAMHEPHQAPAAHREKYRGRFDAGWDVVRQETYERQLELGIIPAGTGLAPHNPGVKLWAELTENEQRLAARLQETFAAFMDHTDEQIGRLVRFLGEIDELDDTILILTGDNGTSGQGGPTGSFRSGGGGPRGVTNDGGLTGEADPELRGPVFVDDPDAVQPELDDIGTARSVTDIPWGWSEVGNTPLRWYKGDTHGGGVRVPLIVHWPERIREPGIRHQFHYVTDIVPTVLELVDVKAPSNYRGYEQLPVTGTGFAYTIDGAADSSRKPVQHFEMHGNRGIWQDGWKAVTRHVIGMEYSDAEWELYHLDEDFSELNNLAEQEPERLRALIDRWWIEASREGVFPMDDRMAFHGGRPSRRPGGVHEGLRYRYLWPISHVPGRASPPLGIGDWRLTADVERADSGEEGVLFSEGSMNGGVSVFVQDNRLCIDFNARTRIMSARSGVEIPAGRASIGVRVERNRERGGGDVTFVINGADVDRGHVETLAGTSGRGGADVGRDRLSPVTNSYDAPFTFMGTIHSVEVQVNPGNDERTVMSPEEASERS